jgi:pimeloyl-ACP methyl ester carboxylesterase
MDLSRNRTLLKRVVAPLAGLAALGVAGAVYQSLSEARDAEKFPPPGRLVDVGGHRLHLNCTGEGTPAVVLDSGLSRTSLDWSLVQPRVAEFTRICSYDRASSGWSEPGPRPRTSQRIARELHALLTNAGIGGPYVLVGHSSGGLNVRVFAGLYPDEVAGVVLVDPAPDNQGSHFTTKLPWRTRLSQELAWQWYRLSRPILARMGVLRLWGQPNSIEPELPPDVQPAARALGLRYRAYDWLAGEAADIRASEEQVRAAGKLPDVPLVVISAHPDAAPPGFSIEQTDCIWLRLHEELARLSEQGSQVIAEGSGHMVMLDRPDLVVEAIRQVVERARQ